MTLWNYFDARGEVRVARGRSIGSRQKGVPGAGELRGCVIRKIEKDGGNYLRDRNGLHDKQLKDWGSDQRTPGSPT